MTSLFHCKESESSAACGIKLSETERATNQAGRVGCYECKLQITAEVFKLVSEQEFEKLARKFETERELETDIDFKKLSKSRIKRAYHIFLNIIPLATASVFRKILIENKTRRQAAKELGMPEGRAQVLAWASYRLLGRAVSVDKSEFENIEYRFRLSTGLRSGLCIIRCLKKTATLKDAAALTEKEILKCPNVGKRRVEELRQILLYNGMNFKG
jgi:hypothetical protein